MSNRSEDTDGARIRRELEPNNLGIALYSVEQDYPPEPPSWYHHNGTCAELIAHAIPSDIPGDSTPLILDLLIKNVGEIEGVITGYQTTPVYLGEGECGAAEVIEYGPSNRQPIDIDMDLKIPTKGRFSAPIGIPPGGTALLRTTLRLARDEAQCGPSFIGQISLFYFDGHREQELLVGNFGFNSL
jgi:hypothetical protein